MLEKRQTLKTEPLLTIFARNKMTGKANADTTMILVMNHINSLHGLDSFVPKLSYVHRRAIVNGIGQSM